MWYQNPIIYGKRLGRLTTFLSNNVLLNEFLKINYSYLTDFPFDEILIGLKHLFVLCYTDFKMNELKIGVLKKEKVNLT